MPLRHRTRDGAPPFPRSEPPAQGSGSQLHEGRTPSAGSAGRRRPSVVPLTPAALASAGRGGSRTAGGDVTLEAMALVSCPECRGAVSSAAASCPHCGHPMTAPAAALAVPAGDGAAERDLWAGTPSVKAMLRTIVMAGLFSLGLPVAVYLAYDPV